MLVPCSSEQPLVTPPPSLSFSQSLSLSLSLSPTLELSFSIVLRDYHSWFLMTGMLRKFRRHKGDRQHESIRHTLEVSV